MKYQKGDLVRWDTNSYRSPIRRTETIVVITGIVEQLYEYPYGQGYTYIYIESGRKDQCGQKDFEIFTEMLG